MAVGRAMGVGVIAVGGGLAALAVGATVAVAEALASAVGAAVETASAVTLGAALGAAVVGPAGPLVASTTGTVAAEVGLAVV